MSSRPCLTCRNVSTYRPLEFIVSDHPALYPFNQGYDVNNNGRYEDEDPSGYRAEQVDDPHLVVAQVKLVDAVTPRYIASRPATNLLFSFIVCVPFLSYSD